MVSAMNWVSYFVGLRFVLAPITLGVFGFLGAFQSSGETVYCDSGHGLSSLSSDKGSSLPEGAPTDIVDTGSNSFNLYYLDVINDTNFGFDDPTPPNPDDVPTGHEILTEGELRRKTVADVLTYIGAVLNQPGELDILFAESRNEIPDPGVSTALASGHTDIELLDVGFQNGNAFRRLTQGAKPNPGKEEIEVEVNFGRPFHAGPASLLPAGEFDLFSVLLHEFTHGLGVFTVTDESGEPRNIFGVFRCYTVWDLFIESEAASRLFIMGDLFPEYAGEAGDLVSGALFWGGAGAQAEYGQDQRPGIYAPEPFDEGSSLSHWDLEKIVGGAVMEPAISSGVARRHYAPLEIGALRDLGWSNAVAIPPVDEGEPLLVVVEVILDSFSNVNTDRNFELSIQEARTVYSDLTDAQFAALDSDDNDGISLREILEASLLNGTAIEVPVPSFLGIARSDAERAIPNAGFTLGDITEVFSSTVPAGSIAGQSPAAGTVARLDTAINLTVSMGEEPEAMIQVPSVVGRPRAEAQSAITHAGLTLGSVIEVASATVAAGHVVSQNPQAGATVAAGSPVNLEVSKGSSGVGCPFLEGNSKTIADRLGDFLLLGLALIVLAGLPGVDCERS